MINYTGLVQSWEKLILVQRHEICQYVNSRKEKGTVIPTELISQYIRQVVDVHPQDTGNYLSCRNVEHTAAGWRSWRSWFKDNIEHTQGRLDRQFQVKAMIAWENRLYSLWLLSRLGGGGAWEYRIRHGTVGTHVKSDKGLSSPPCINWGKVFSAAVVLGWLVQVL